MQPAVTGSLVKFSLASQNASPAVGRERSVRAPTLRRARGSVSWHTGTHEVTLPTNRTHFLQFFPDELTLPDTFNSAEVCRCGVTCVISAGNILYN